MKTFLLTLASVFAATQAFAVEEYKVQTREILAALISDAATLQVVEADGSQSKESLAAILGEALAMETLVAPGKTAPINSVSGSCEVTDVGRGGIAYLDCVLYITNGDYVATERGYEGPHLESALILSFEAIKSLKSDGVLKVQSKVKRIIAG